MTRWCALLAIGTTWGCVAGEIGIVGGEGGAVTDDDDRRADDDDTVDQDWDRPLEEQCGNDLDDNGDGAVDENCGCTAGEDRSCYPGPAGTSDVGICTAGVQHCDDHFEFPEWGACEGAVLPGLEVNGNGVDDDCNGAADCAEAAFAEDEACVGPCPGGTPTYAERDLGAGFGGSGIEAGDGEPEMEMTCGEPSCDAAHVAILHTDGTIECVEPPPACAEGTYATWDDPATEMGPFGDRFEGDAPDLGGEPEDPHWECDPPCELIIHYGGIYGNKTVCAEDPDLVCPDASTVPTWVYETEEWECRQTCDNGMYDQIILDGAMVCVPC